jgi:hypothetical protein
MDLKYKLLIIGYTSWCGLGFIRGVNSYNYSHNKYEKNKPYIYIDSMINGILGITVYTNPLLLPITIHKELYRLETNIRNLEDEKNSSYYNILL